MHRDQGLIPAAGRPAGIIRVLAGLFGCLLLFPLPGMAGNVSTGPSVIRQAPVAIHQFGIVRQAPADAAPVSSGSRDPSGRLPVPGFVHRTEPGRETPAGAATLRPVLFLDWSALYINPPRMTTAPTTLDIRQSFPGGALAAWYPYAAAHGPDFVSWNRVRVGVMADCLDTTQPDWMAGRRVEHAATTFVRLPVPPGVHPGDPGTTEGEVFLFARGALAGLPPLRITPGKEPGTWNLQRTDGADSVPDALASAWIVADTASGDCQTSRIHLSSGRSVVIPPNFAVSFSPGPPATSGSWKDRQEFHFELTEMLAGNGLMPDEAVAAAHQVEDVLARQAAARLKNRAGDRPAPPLSVVFFPSAEWLRQAAPLDVKGNATPPLRLFVVVASFPPGNESR